MLSGALVPFSKFANFRAVLQNRQVSGRSQGRPAATPPKAQKSGLLAVGNLTSFPVMKSRVVSAHTISGHWPNGLSGRR
jgi:hypothetical protein